MRLATSYRLMAPMRVGQDHWRAKITDRDVELIRSMLRDRRATITELRQCGSSQWAIDGMLRDRGLSFRCIAIKFEVSKSLVRAIYQEKVRVMDGCTSATRAGVGLSS